MIFLNFLFCIGIQPTHNIVIVSGGQQRDSAIRVHVSILPQTSLPSRLPHNIEQNSLCYIVRPCWLSILNIAECIWSKIIFKGKKRELWCWVLWASQWVICLYQHQTVGQMGQWSCRLCSGRRHHPELVPSIQIVTPLSACSLGPLPDSHAGHLPSTVLCSARSSKSFQIHCTPLFSSCSLIPITLKRSNSK